MNVSLLKVAHDGVENFKPGKMLILARRAKGAIGPSYFQADRPCFKQMSVQFHYINSISLCSLKLCPGT